MASSSNSFPTFGCRDKNTRKIKQQIERLAVPSKEWIDGCLVPAEPTNQFFPINLLRDKVLNTKIVDGILRHRCDYCMKQIQLLPQTDINITVRWIVGNTSSPPLSHTAISIFALLIFIENPLLIFSFFHKQINDSTFTTHTENYEPDTLYELWPDFHRHHKEASETAALNFRIQKWRFAVPHMTHGEHTRFEAKHILPFAMQKELGLWEEARENGEEQDCDYVGHDKGANGKVFKVEIHQGYGNFGYAETQSMIYARKEITAPDTLWHILGEANNLHKVNQLHHPHIIRLVKTYQQGKNNFNIIFPYAKANLHRYLRIPSLGAPRSSTDLSQNRLWPQILGVAEGLNLIINGSRNKESFIGFHFDLKPQNILVLEKQKVDTLVISDFGQARLIDRGDRFTSRRTFGGGTDSYTPPESSDGFVLKAQHNKYDIWPLGIILVEVLSFVVKGESGPKRLDKVRETSESRGVDSRFWRIPDRTSRGELKPEIVRFMNDIRDAPEKEENRVFVRKVLDLAKNMLHPDPEHRISIDRTVQMMRVIFSCERRSVHRRDVSLQAGEKVLLTIGKILHTHRSYTKETAFNVYERPHRNDFKLTFDTSDETSTEMPTALRSDLKLCPDFVLNGFGLPRGVGRVISFVHVRGGVTSFDDHVYEFEDDEETDLVFEELTRQEVLMRSQKVLQKATWSKYLTRTENLKEALFSRERTIKSQELDALRVEIWIEGLEYDDDEPSTDETSSILTDHSLYPISPSSSSTGNSGFPKKRRRRGRRVVKKMEPPKRRIVVYCRDRIITVRFAKACRFPPSYHEPGKGIPKSGILKLGLTNNAMCFEINQIFPDEESGHTYAGIPLCWNALAAEEEKGAERVTSLSLTFMNESDAEDFYKEYFEEKNLWLAEVKAKDNGHLQ